MKNAVAFANNDVVTIAWSYGTRPQGCMGFSLHRIAPDGTETPLPSHAVFPGFRIERGQTTDAFPLQKFYWKDVYARAIADKTGNRVFRYRVIPMQGAPGHLQPMAALGQLITNEVTLGGDAGDGVTATFNRGLISTQGVSEALGGDPTKAKLLPQVADAASALRRRLAGGMIAALVGFLERAQTQGEIYAALYELEDEELVAALTRVGARLHVILANHTFDPAKGALVDKAKRARDALAGSGATCIDRIMDDGHIGHNKFLVQVVGGKARAVLYGSTNWTSTGLCTQTNNTVVMDEPRLAARYLAYWKALAADTAAAKGDVKAIPRSDGSRLECWFSPNTPKPRSSPTGEAVPPDMAAVKACIAGAKQAVLFLAFNPGSPSLAQWTAAAQKANRDLFVRGCVTEPAAAAGFFYALTGATPPPAVKGEKKPARFDPRVIAADALSGGTVPDGWQQEILNAGFAIVHDKILVIDPFSADCVVISGSHNLGHRASYNNDENLTIVRGNRKLAAAYATHVLDVYDHFAWRVRVRHEGGDGRLQVDPDAWMAKYFDAQGAPKTAQLKFWMSATV